MTSVDLKYEARALFERAVRVADPARALRKIFNSQPLVLPTMSGRFLVLAWGKASCAMIEETLLHIPSSVDMTAIAATNYENFRDIKGAEILAAGHPLPDENGLKAAQKITAFLEKATLNDRVVCLISGGGSALLPSPISPLTLADKIAVNDLLLKSGFDIVETNSVRQHLSRLKGGGVVRLGAPAKISSFIVSDVIGDDVRAIASGPTACPLCTPKEAISLLKERDLWARFPKTAKDILKQKSAQNTPVHHHADNHIICSNGQSLDALCEDIKNFVRPKIMSYSLIGDVENAAQEIVHTIAQQDRVAPVALIWGGETTVTVRGNGRGGRNQELCLRVGKALCDLEGDWIFLSGGTDGRDGPTDAAGGIITPQSLPMIEKAGLDINALLHNNDSYAALEKADALLKIGGTGTNVADIQIFMKA